MVSFYLLFCKISFVSGFVSIPYLYYMKGIKSVSPADRDSALQKNKKNFIVYFLINSEEAARRSQSSITEGIEGGLEAYDEKPPPPSVTASGSGLEEVHGSQVTGEPSERLVVTEGGGGLGEATPEGGEFIYIESFFNISECLFFIEKIKRKNYIYWISVT